MRRPYRLFVVEARHQLSAIESAARALDAEMNFYQELLAAR
jgi:hypothetical protein